MQRWVWVLCLSFLIITAAACSKKNTNTTGAASKVGVAATASATTASGAVGSATAKASASPATVASGASASTRQDLTPIEKLVQDVRPSVVRVEASATTTQRGPFGLAGPQPQQGTGTGIVLDSQGHILTNNHVVTLEGQSVASSLKVDLANGKTVDAKLTGNDPQTDLAVIQVSEADIAGVQPIQWADPNSIIVGETVVAIGYALDLGGEPTVTTGVVSATNRTIPEPNGVTISNAIQTDAAINPGNSGGPLLNLDGHVIGINTAGLTGSQGQPAQGLNFAISVTTARKIAEDLVSKGKVTRGYMGVGVVDITQQFAQANNLSIDHGAGIQQVAQGSPAAQAGLQPGDIIVKVGDVAINSSGDLTNALTQYAPGAAVPIAFYRGNTQKNTTITLGQRPGP